MNAVTVVEAADELVPHKVISSHDFPIWLYDSASRPVPLSDLQIVAEIAVAFAEALKADPRLDVQVTLCDDQVALELWFVIDINGHLYDMWYAVDRDTFPVDQHNAVRIGRWLALRFLHQFKV